MDKETELQTFPIEERYMYRYCKVTLQGQDLLAKKSCKRCYGTGVYCQWLNPRTNVKQTVYCDCMIKKEKQPTNQGE